MKNDIFKSSDCYGEYFITSTPINTINFDVFANAFYKLSDYISLDDFTIKNLKDFAVYGFTKNRVDGAPVVKDEKDQMVLFAYDSEFKRPVGLAICFNGKFYALGYKEGRRAEIELYNIFTHRKKI